MKFEIPEYARCCFCFPLRLGLLLWFYVKLVFSLLLLANLIGVIVTYCIHVHYPERVHFPCINLIIFSILLCVDIAFHIIFIVSAHKKEYKNMKLFYKEEMVALGVYVFCFFYYTLYVLYDFQFSFRPLSVSSKMWTLLTIWSIFFLITISQAYLIILVRSEALKLERSSKNFEFTNRAVDAEAIYNNDIVA